MIEDERLILCLDSQACMLTFYPEFEVDNITDNEIVILLDLSNSMKVSTYICAVSL